jgi:hypothetical protein
MSRVADLIARFNKPQKDKEERKSSTDGTPSEPPPRLSGTVASLKSRFSKSSLVESPPGSSTTSPQLPTRGNVRKIWESREERRTSEEQERRNSQADENDDTQPPPGKVR